MARRADLWPRRLAAGSHRHLGDRVQVQRHTDGWHGPAEATHQIVIAAAGSGSPTGPRNEKLEMDPGVVLQPPYFAEIVHQVGPLTRAERRIERKKVLESRLGCLGRAPGSFLQCVAAADHEGE